MQIKQFEHTYYTILYFTMLYHTIPYYTILHYAILYYIILYYTILYYTIPYYALPYYTVLYYTVLYYTMLYLFYSIFKSQAILFIKNLLNSFLFKFGFTSCSIKISRSLCGQRVRLSVNKTVSYS